MSTPTTTQDLATILTTKDARIAELEAQVKALRMAIYHIIKDQGLNSDNAELAQQALRDTERK